MSATGHTDTRRAWAILVNHTGAVDADSNWVQFRQWWDGYDGGYDEFRFMGDLGFGGKIYRTPRGLHVSCYREDETPQRRSIIAATNQRLEELRSGETPAQGKDGSTAATTSPPSATTDSPQSAAARADTGPGASQ